MKITGSKLISILCLFLAACSSEMSSINDESPPSNGTVKDDAGSNYVPEADAGPAPTESASPSADYQVSGAKKFYIIGKDEALELTVKGPASTIEIEIWAAGKLLGRAKSAAGNGQFTIKGNLSSLAAGEYRALLAVRGAGVSFATVNFIRSHPYYIFMSNDWDTPDDDPTGAVNTTQEDFHKQHAELKITHFVGPYTFTDSSVSETRRAALTKWLLSMKTTYGDEIGLHIHPRCSFITAAGVTCRTTPSVSAPSGTAGSDSSGYTVVLTEYSYEEMIKLLDKADSLFTARGIGKPTSFRAGAWTAQIHTLSALANRGYVVDASAANWARLTQWQGQNLYDWNKKNWSSINDTSQPYYPSMTNILSDAAPHLTILEVPGNGILVDYITGAQMIEVFDKNYPGGALLTPKVLSIGYHPVSLKKNASWATYLHQIMSYADKRLASKGDGPVIYARGSDLPAALLIKP